MAEVEILGIYSKTISRDSKTGSTIFLLMHCQDSVSKIVCIGKILPISVGKKIVVRGEWTTDKVYGRQIIDAKVFQAEMSLSEIKSFMMKCKISNTAATEVIDRYGGNLKKLLCMPDCVSKLAKIRGISKSKAENFIVEFRNDLVRSELYNFLISHGGTYENFRVVYKKLGDRALEKIKEHPYKATRRMGLKFEVKDSIAKGEKRRFDDIERVVDGVLYAMFAAASYGDTYCGRVQLIQLVQTKLSNDIFQDKLTIPIILLGIERALNEGVTKEGERYYLKHLRTNEINVARSVVRLSKTSDVIRKGYSKDLSKSVMQQMGVVFSHEQQKAFAYLKKSGIKVILGAPGTGKTTLIKGLVIASTMMDPDAKICLCAPTGRAAQRLAETTQREAFTIHRLLQFKKPETGSAEYLSEESPLSADIIFVDESSMLSIELADLLLRSIKTGAVVFLLGDCSQLAPVGAGAPLYDLVRSKCIPVLVLADVFRQKKESAIYTNIRMIDAGSHYLKQGKDFRIFSRKDKEMYDCLYEKYMELRSQVDENEIQIISPMVNIVSTINKQIQHLLNKDCDGVRYGGVSYKVGDKVLMVHTNYQVGYFNGDIGSLTYVSPSYMRVKIRENELIISSDFYDHIQLGYAITTHKAQGSEWKYVFVVLPETAKYSSRRLLYTSLSRGKTKVLLFASKNSIYQAVKKNDDMKRNTRLCERIIALSKQQGGLSYEKSA